MLGNKLHIMFYPNPKGRNQASILRWGFKIKITPIYGFLDRTNKSEEHEGRNDVIAAISIVNVVVAEHLSYYLEGNALSDDEKLN